MTTNHSLTELEQHFAFGKNWAAYAKEVGDASLSAELPPRQDRAKLPVLERVGSNDVEYFWWQPLAD
jgi:hypothetical protein